MTNVTPPPTPIGVRLKQLRERRGWSQGQLAEASSVSRPAISRIESGHIPNPGRNTLRGLADALGLPVSSFDSDEPPPQVSFAGVTSVPIVSVAHAGDQNIWHQTGGQALVSSDMSRGRRLLAADVLGECLAPEVEPGDTVVFDARATQPEHGDMVVVTLENGELLVRRMGRTRDGSPVLVAHDGPPMRPNGARVEGVVVLVLKLPGRKPVMIDE